jgi:hypothetical protein
MRAVSKREGRVTILLRKRCKKKNATLRKEKSIKQYTCNLKLHYKSQEIFVSYVIPRECALKSGSRRDGTLMFIVWRCEYIHKAARRNFKWLIKLLNKYLN